ncbi:MAG: hypothetical protein NDI61_01135, partial [Bdellovibrionaceae bacterium]|nr:hypothetical protein [Pseudobdellovibrionaceae bacterium]
APGSVAMASPAGGTTTVKPTTLATAQASASVMRETEPSSAPASTGASAAPSTDGTDVSEAKEAKPKGFVYRAFMNVASVDEVTPEVTKQLESLGGEKAGEVPLGWRKGAGSYFHFTISETHVEEVTKLLRTYGPVRISKDPHPRVMPTGQVRFILWVEPQTSGN